MGEIFDSVADKYDHWYRTEIGSLVHEIEMNIVMDLLKPEAGQSVLDVGCGTGHYSILLARRGLSVSGLDISREMLSYAKSKSALYGLSVRWLTGDAGELPFAGETFDLVVSVTALEFLPRPSVVLREAHRVLKPGGRMVFGVIGGGSPWSERYERKAREDKDSIYRDAKFFTAKEMLALFPEAEGRAVKGLYFPPEKDSTFNRRDALAAEKSGRQGDKDGAGFIAALWTK